MMAGNIPSPHSHPGMMQQPPTPIGPPGQSPLARYMMAQSPQAGVYRPQMSPMNMMSKIKLKSFDDSQHVSFIQITVVVHKQWSTKKCTIYLNISLNVSII